MNMKKILRMKDNMKMKKVKGEKFPQKRKKKECSNKLAKMFSKKKLGN